MKHKANRIRGGLYLYREFTISCVGYYPPDRKVVWEAYGEDNCGDFHGFSLREVKHMIDLDLDGQKGSIMKNINLGLCRNRHEMPIRDFLFEKEINPTKPDDLYGEAFWQLRRFTDHENHSIKPVPFTGGETGGDNYVLSADVHIHLYVTGLTVALVAAINACHTLHLPLTLWHYNRDTGEYYPQEVNAWS